MAKEKMMKGVDTESEHRPRAFSDDDPNDKKMDKKNLIKHFQSPPLDFKKTTCSNHAMKSFNKKAVTQLHGPRGMGKKVISNVILNEVANSKTIVWEMQPFSSLETMVKEFKNVADIISKEMPSLINLDNVKDEQVGATFMKQLTDMEIVSAFGLTLLPGCEKEGLSFITNMVREVVDSSKNLKTPVVKILLSTSTMDAIFDKDEISSINDQYWQVEISGFNHGEEAVEYLKANSNEGNLSGRVSHQNGDVNQENTPKTKDDEFAEKVAIYFNYNPTCLKGVKLYCDNKEMSYELYYRLINSESTRSGMHKETLELLQQLQSGNPEAYKEINKVEPDKYPVNHESVADFLLNVWRLLDHEDLPMLLVTQIFHYCDQNREKNLSHEENSTLNLKMTYDAISSLKKTHGVKIVSLANPNSTISISKNKFDAIQVENKQLSLDIALKAITSLLDKDNRQANADIILYQLTTHMEVLCKNLGKNWDSGFVMKESDKENFLMYMRVCRLSELLGQAMVLGQDKSKWVTALGVLFRAATIVWDGVCSFESQDSFLTCFFSKKVNRDALEYHDETTDPQKNAKHIVGHCIKAGKKLHKKSAGNVKDYLMHTLKINQSNLDDFVFNCEEGGESKDFALSNFKEVKAFVQSKHPLTREMFEKLQTTGNGDIKNLLSIEKYCEVFLAERLASIFHIYGRQVLYLKNRMDPKDQRKCEYYAELAHEISVEIRTKTGIGLIYEYITTANSMVPRKLQDRLDESKHQRLERLEKAYELSKELLTDPGPMYEEGKYKRIMGTPYTTLNAYKCIVKANCKQLKDHANPGNPSTRAKAECNELFKIAKKNISINMAPNCCFQAMKFYAATGNFDYAFEVFEVGFKTENPLNKNQVFGISQLQERNANTFVWGICNYLMAVKAMEKSDTYNGNLVVGDFTNMATRRYNEVIKIQGISEELTKRLEKLKFP